MSEPPPDPDPLLGDLRPTSRSYSEAVALQQHVEEQSGQRHTPSKAGG